MRSFQMLWWTQFNYHVKILNFHHKLILCILLAEVSKSIFSYDLNNEIQIWFIFGWHFMLTNVAFNRHCKDQLFYKWAKTVSDTYISLKTMFFQQISLKYLVNEVKFWGNIKTCFENNVSVYYRVNCQEHPCFIIKYHFFAFHILYLNINLYSRFLS